MIRCAAAMMRRISAMIRSLFMSFPCCPYLPTTAFLFRTVRFEPQLFDRFQQLVETA